MRFSRAKRRSSPTSWPHRSPRLEDLNGLMRTMMKTALERMLNTEMDVHLQRRGLTRTPTQPRRIARSRLTHDHLPNNRRNGHSKKTVRGDMGEFTPPDATRPQRHLRAATDQAKDSDGSTGFDEKILALYAKGMTTRDIQEIVQELYGVEVSAHARLRDHRRPGCGSRAPGVRGGSMRFGPSCTSTASWYMCVAKTVESAGTRCTWRSA